MDISKYFNMVWTAGFNSGAKINQECAEGKLTNEEQIKARTHQLMNDDADSIDMLLKLNKEMEK
jgi:hypothetical protein